MAPLPDIRGPDRAKPLSLDPATGKYIYLDDLIAGREKLVPLSKLSREQQKQLVIERNRTGADYRGQPISGAAFTGADVADEVDRETPFGKSAMDAELSMLSELHERIAKALAEKDPG